MYCPECGCTSAKEVMLFTSIKLQCWACDVTAEIKRQIRILQNEFAAVDNVTVTKEKESSDIKVTVKLALPCQYSFQSGWAEQ
jgi:hypothetical protein